MGAGVCRRIVLL